MPITIDHEYTAAISALNPIGYFPRELIVDLGRPNFESFTISMREIIQWTAYRLDREDGNHRTASLIRAVAEQFYPVLRDEAEVLLDDLHYDGVEVDFDFAEVPPPAVDPRLLGLADGFAICSDTFYEADSNDLVPSAHVRNADNYLDFEFPEGAVERYNIRGIRVHALDLIHCIQSTIEVGEASFQSEDAWLDALELSHARHEVNHKYRSEVRLRARCGDDAVDTNFAKFDLVGPASPEEQDAILEALGDL